MSKSSKKPDPEDLAAGWNYRLIRHVEVYGTGREEVYYQIHSAHYRRKSSYDAVPVAWSETPYSPLGDSVENTIDDMLLLLTAFARPVLEVYFTKTGGKKLRNYKPDKLDTKALERAKRGVQTIITKMKDREKKANVSA